MTTEESKRVEPSRKEKRPIRREQVASKERDAEEEVLSRNKQQKTLKYERKSKEDPNHETILQAKRLWEKARVIKTPRQERKSLVREIVNLFEGRLGEVCTKNDVSRMMQTCIQVGWIEDVNKIALGLVGSYSDVATNPYGKFILLSLLETCSVSRALCATDFTGKVMKLVKNKNASAVVDVLFRKHLRPEEKHALMSEFYGNEFVVFKEQGVTLESVINKNPAKRPLIMAKLRTVLESSLQKENLHHVIVHHLMLDYLRWEDKKRVEEWATGLHELLPEMLTSEEGSEAAIRILALSSTKERKTILKSLKDHVVKISKGEYSHRFLLGLFDVIDDTKLVSKLIESLTSDLGSVMKNVHSRRCVLFLLGGKSPFYVPERTIHLLDQVKEINTGKKDALTRYQELRSYALKPVVDFCVDNLEMMSMDSFKNGVIVEALVINQEEEMLIPLIDKILAMLREADVENASRLANFVKKLAKRAEEPLARKLAEAMVLDLHLWIQHVDAVSTLCVLGSTANIVKESTRKLARTDSNSSAIDQILQ